jgi:hypothetical protein
LDISGTITHSTTWSPESASAYVIEGVLDVPAGVTLTLAPGTVVKASGADDYNEQYPYNVNVEGTLDAVGTAARPVIFTSVNDNTAGGDTGTGVPKAGDWGGILLTGSGSADLQHDDIRYAASAVTALGGPVVFRGTFTDNKMGVTACDWGSGNCSVDAAYSSWGDGKSGPFPASGSLVCGAVTVSPWIPGGNKAGAFTDGNCDSAPTPDVVLSQAEQAYGQGIAAICGNGNQGTCQAIQTAQQCLSAAFGLAKKSSPFTLPAIGGDVISAADTWLENSESLVASVVGVADFAADIAGAVGTILDLAAAYNQCDPG